MRKRILQLEQGEIDQPRAKVSFSVNELEDTLFPGDVWNTFIQIKSENHVPIRGIIHSLNPAVTVTPTQIDGMAHRVNVQVEVPAHYVGDKIEGVIEWVTDAGEYETPYHFFIADKRESGLDVCFCSLEQLAQEAKQDFDRTARLFASDDFLKMPLMQHDLKLCALYRSVSQGRNWRRALEDFLVYTEQKKPITVHVKSDVVVFREGEASKIDLMKDEWGYLNVQVSAERTGFVTVLPYKPSYEAGRCEIFLESNPSRLHAGKNQCSVTITTSQQSLRVMAVKQMPSKRTAKRGMPLFPWVWEKETQEEIEQKVLHDWEEYRDVWDIWKLILAQELEQAADGRNRLQEQAEAEKESNPLLYAIWMMEGAYVTYGVQKTQILQWLYEYAQEKRDAFVLFLYCRAAGSLIEQKLAEQWFREGCHSPYLYHLVLQLWREKTPDWRQWDSGLSTQVIAYSLKHHLEEDTMWELYFAFLKNQHSGRPALIRMLGILYQKSQKDEILEKIVKILLQGRKIKPSYFKWFELAVEHDLKIVGLYEAFLSTVPRGYDRRFPYLLLHYYTYNNDISDIWKEKIYQNVFQYYAQEDSMKKEYDSASQAFPFSCEAWKGGAFHHYLSGSESRMRDSLIKLYLPQIQEYVTVRILRREFSSHLSEIYGQVISTDILDEDLADGVLQLCCAWNICVGSEKVRSVAIRYPQMEKEWIYAVRENQVCVPIYNDEAIILFLDRYGVIQTHVDWKKEKVPMADELRLRCMELLPRHISQSLTAYHQIAERGIDGEEMLGWAEWLLDEKAGLCLQAKRQVQDSLIEYCSEHPQEHRYDTLLLEAQAEQLGAWNGAHLMEALVGRGFWERAYSILQQMGFEFVPSEQLLAIADALIEEKKAEKDEFLLFLSYYLLEQDTANHRVIEYLNCFAEGGNQTLYPIFVQSKKRRIAYGQLLSNMMVQSLFSGNFEWLGEIAPEYYEQEDADSHIVQAAHLADCHQFLIRQKDLESHTVEWLMRENDEKILLVKLAWISYVAQHPELDREIQTRAWNDMVQSCGNGIVLSSFAKMVEREESVPESLEGRVIVEVHASPHKNVFLEYTLCADKEESFNRPMREVYPGIYILAVTVFSDERLDYRAAVESTAGIDLSENLQILCSERIKGNTASTYAGLEQIIEQSFSVTEKESEEMMRQLTKKKKMIEKLFPYRKNGNL